MSRIVLSDSAAAVEIDAALGAGLARYDLLGPNGREPLFRPAPATVRDPFDLACNLLIPWSNRISGGGFRFDGQFHALAPNRPGEPFPLHGNAFALPWTALATAPNETRLSLDSDGPGPFRYRAEVGYRLDAGALAIDLSVTNKAPYALPFGLGLHPWLPRTSQTTLRAPAAFVWLEDERHLPAGRAAIETRSDWDFRRARSLPAGWINNAFGEWDGHATAHWAERHLSLAVTASPPLSTCLVYSPGADADFFCFEPVSHPVNAFNLPGGPEANGLKVLRPHETLRAQCRFTPARHASDHFMRQESARP